MREATSKSPHGRWLLTESVVVVDDKTVGATDRGLNDDFQIQAAVVRAANGDLLVMTTLVNPYRVVLVRSGDLGRTWSQPKVVWQRRVGEELYFGFANMKRLRSGRILTVIWGYHGKGGWPQKDIRTPWFVLYSDDHGQTWMQGPLQSPRLPFLSEIAYNAMAVAPDGTVILPVWGHIERDAASSLGGVWGTGFLLSRDEGMTWSFGSMVMRGEKSIGTMPNEMAVQPLRSGHWLAVFRMNRVKPSNFDPLQLFRSVSRDQGRTWSAPHQVLGQTGYPCLQELPDGGVMVSGSGAFGTRYLVSHDEGLTWSYEQPLESCGDAATTSVVLDEKTVFLVHGSGMGAPHHGGYWYAGLRGWWIRKS